MDVPPLEELLAAVYGIVRPAAKKNQLHNLSYKLVRAQIEEKFGLEAGTLNAAEYRAPLREATQKAMGETSSDSEGETHSQAPKAKERTKLESSSPAANVKRKLGDGSKGAVGQEEGDSEGEQGVPKKKKRTSRDKAGKNEGEGSSKKGTSASKSRAKPKATNKKASPPPSSKAKGKRKFQASEDEEEEGTDDDEDYSEEEMEPPKKKRAPKSKQLPAEDAVTAKGKAKAASKPKAASSSAAAKKAASKKATIQYKTPEHVPTSDMEQDEPVRPSPGKGKSPAKSPQSSPKSAPHLDSSSEILPPAKRMKPEPVGDKAEVGEVDSTTVKPSSEGLKKEEESDNAGTPKPKQKKTESSKTRSSPLEKEVTKAKEVKAGGDQSETEAEDLIDEPPKRGEKSKGGDKDAKKTPRKRQSAASSSKGSGLSKDEETIKRLKSFVVACGVRKVWSKVFKGLDSPREQISKLKEILADLGMSGRMSLEQAKAIKQKREFEKELEDVQEFEKTMRKRDSRKAGAPEGPSSDVAKSEAEKSESEEEANLVLRKRKRNARNSIAAFLQDQSESE